MEAALEQKIDSYCAYYHRVTMQIPLLN